MKSDFSIQLIDKRSCEFLLHHHHYLSKQSKGFKSGYNFGLIYNDEIVGVCIFTGFPVPELSKSIFGLDRKDQKGFFELSRLCLDPVIQKNEHNIASWFVSRCINQIRKLTTVRCILSYADDDHHKGTIYRACNFKYYGKTTPKKDFWIRQSDGSFVKHSRGSVKGLEGKWLSRSQKHRFLMVFDKKLKVQWNEQ